MKKKFVVLGILFAFLGLTKVSAQEDENSGKKMSVLDKAIVGFTFGDAEAASLAKESVRVMDSITPVADPTNGYAIRLDRLFGKHSSSEGVNLNYKVYLVKGVNAFAAADGSVRVFAGLMDIMDDNELLAVIGHEIGHVVNHDTRDKLRAAYKKEALMDAVSSQSKTFKAMSKTELGKLGNAMLDSKHSRKQESEADEFAYDFMKKNGYDVNAVESSFRVLQKISEGADSSLITRMKSSHPDPGKRADEAKKRATKDGLFKAYVQQEIVNTPPVTTTAKTTTKKTTTKKK